MKVVEEKETPYYISYKLKYKNPQKNISKKI